MKESVVEQRLEQMNSRLFALEGRMGTFEGVSKIEGNARTDLLHEVIKNQHDAELRLRKVELKIAAYAGAVLVLGTVIDAAIKIYLK